MPRIAWSRLLILLIALPLASCFDGQEACLTCPPENSGRIDVLVPLLGETDSLHVNLDGGARVTVRRGRRVSFEGLSAGVHTVQVVRWFEDFSGVTSKTSVVEVRLERGDSRVILFHNDFPLVSAASPPGHISAPPAAVPAHDGWASA